MLKKKMEIENPKRSKPSLYKGYQQFGSHNCVVTTCKVTHGCQPFSVSYAVSLVFAKRKCLRWRASLKSLG